MRDIMNNPDFRARLYRKVDVDLFPNPITGTRCWIWKGAHTRQGYGLIRRPHSRAKICAHVATFLMEGGTIPPGMELHHLCSNPTCVNPAHLRAITHRDNIRRGLTGFAKRHKPRQRKSDKRTLQLPFTSSPNEL